MSLNVCNLQAALVQRLMQEDCLNYLLNDCSTELAIDYATGLPSINIAEASPETVSTLPYIGVEILNTRPLVKDSITQYYYSEIMIYAASNKSINARRLMDELMCLFTICPEDFEKPCHSWC